MPSFHPLRRRSHHMALVLGVLLPVYFMVAIGLFNWLPMLWLGSHGHQFVVEDKGQIVEQGNHAELLNKSDGYYKNLYESQFSVESNEI